MVTWLVLPGMNLHSFILSHYTICSANQKTYKRIRKWQCGSRKKFDLGFENSDCGFRMESLRSIFFAPYFLTFQPSALSLALWTRIQYRVTSTQPPNQRPPAELGVWGWPLEGTGATLCWWSLICKRIFASCCFFLLSCALTYIEKIILTMSLSDLSVWMSLALLTYMTKSEKKWAKNSFI